MQNANPIFLTKLLLFTFIVLQSIHCQGDVIQLERADSLFSERSFKEAMELYEKNYSEGVYSSAMLLKMAFIAEGTGDNENATLYLGKYYELSHNPQVINKIKSLTKQANLEGYEVSDTERFQLFLVDNDELILGLLSVLLVVSIVLVLISHFRKTKTPVYWPTALLIMLIFIGNNFLNNTRAGLITNSPSLILSAPTAAGELIQRVEPGHRVKIVGSEDIWYEIQWKDEVAYIKKENVARL